MRNRVLLAVLLVAAPGAAQALEVEAGNFVFAIVHQEYGEIGEHQVAISRRGEDVVIEQAGEMEVDVLLLGGHRREGHSREVWRNGRLISFRATTVEDGETAEVVAGAEGDLLVVEGPAGRFEAPAEAVPSQPLLRATAGRTVLFDIATGEVYETAVLEHGVERILLGDGAAVDALRYEITEPTQDVWYDDSGIWAQWRLLEGNGMITVTRRAFEPAEAP